MPIALITMPGVQNPPLQRMVFAEGRLHGMKFAIRGKTFDGRYVAPVGLRGQHGAGLHGNTVEVDSATAALGGVAPDMGTGKPQMLPDILHQQGAILGLAFDRLTVNCH